MKTENKGINLVFIDNPTLSTAYIKELLHVAEQQDLVAQASLESTVKLLLIVELNRAEQERLTLSSVQRMAWLPLARSQEEPLAILTR